MSNAESATEVTLYACRVCKREYDSELERCPQCKAFQGDNFVMADDAGRPERRAAMERRAAAEAEHHRASLAEPGRERGVGGFIGDVWWELGATGVLLLVGVGLLLTGHTIVGWVVLGFICLPVVLGVLELFE